MTDIPPSSSASRPSFPANAFAADDPPHPLDGEWFVHTDGETYGPYTGRRIADFAKEGRVDGASQVMPVDSDRWRRAAEDPKLAIIFRVIQAAPTPPPPISAAPGATVVQVTNTISAPAPTMVILDDGSPFGPKSPGIALVLSLFLCGAGQMYCGRIGRGFLMLFGSMFMWLIFLGWIIWIWSIIDAYGIAKQMNLRYLMRLQAMQLR